MASKQCTFNPHFIFPEPPALGTRIISFSEGKNRKPVHSAGSGRAEVELTTQLQSGALNYDAGQPLSDTRQTLLVAHPTTSPLLEKPRFCVVVYASLCVFVKANLVHISVSSSWIM